MGSIALELIQNGKRQVQELDVFSYVKKPLETFVYKESLKDSRVPLTYVRSKKIFSDQNININNISEKIRENVNFDSDLEEKSFFVNGSSINTSYNNIKVTNKTGLDQRNNEVPLFYAHRFSETAVSANLEIESNMIEPLEKVYVIDLSVGIYHNYSNFFNEATGEYRLFYVNWIDANGVSYRELLDSADVVYELSWEDIDPVTGQVRAGVFGYEKQGNTVDYSYYLNVSGEYYWAPTSQNYIECKVTKGRESKDPWYLNITNGSFKKVFDNKLYSYKVREYYNQYFAPFFPYTFTAFFDLDWVNRNTLKSDTNSIFYSREKNLNVDIYVYNKENKIKRLLTTDKVKEGNRFEDTEIFWESEIISSIDEQNGFISLREDFQPGDSFKGCFFYKKENFEYSKLNLNPIYNKDSLNHHYVFYCIPDVYDYETSIHYIKVNRAGRIVYCSQGDGLASERASYPCLSIRDEQGSINLNTIVGSRYKGENSFISMYSFLGENEYRYHILGEVSFKEQTNIDEVFNFDMRREGGVLKESKRSIAFRRNRILLQSRYGFGEHGIRYSKSNSHMIEIPLDLTEEYGGVYTKDEIENLVERKMPGFSFNFIDWVHPKGSMIATNESVGSINLEIESYSNDSKVLVYKKNTEQGEYELLQEVQGSSNLYSLVDSDINSGSIYYYCITIKVGDKEYPRHNEVEVFAR